MKKKITTLLCSALALVSLGAGIAFSNPMNVSATGISATGVVTSGKALHEYYKDVTLYKDGKTENDSVKFGGLVPYGEGEISLGTYDMTAASDLNTPLFEVLPQTAWYTSSTVKTSDDMFFTVNLTSGTKTVVFRFCKNNRTDANRAAVYVGNSESSVAAHRYSNAESSDWTPTTGSGEATTTVLPYRYDGTVNDSGVYDMNKATFTQPTPIAFYYNNGAYAMNAHKAAKSGDATTVVTVEDGTYRYNISKFKQTFTAEELKSVEVSVKFDNAPATQDDSWVTFTSIGGKKISDYLENGALLSVAPSTGATTSTIAYNEKVTLSDNTALTKLFEIDTSAFQNYGSETTATAGVKDVVASFKGSENTLYVRFTRSLDMQTVRTLISTRTNGSSEPLYWTATKRGDADNTEGSYIDSGLGATTVSNTWTKECGYWFDGKVNNSDNQDEKGKPLTSGTTVTPKFAIYYDHASKTFYSDAGRDGVGEVDFNGVSRYKVLDMSANATFLALAEEKLSVSVDVTVADNKSASLVKVTTIDGATLDGGENAKVGVVSYSTQTEQTVWTEGLPYDAPALYVNGEAVESYIVKINGAVASSKRFTAHKGENVFEYVTTTGVVYKTTITAEGILTHRGAALRYVEGQTDAEKGGIRYMVAMRKDSLTALAGRNFTAGMLVISEDKLGDGTLDLNNTTAVKREFDLKEGKYGEVTIDGVEYIQMTVYVPDITSENFGSKVLSVGYITIDNTTYYSEVKARSLSYVAYHYCNNDPKADAVIKEVVKGYIVDGETGVED